MKKTFIVFLLGLLSVSASAQDLPLIDLGLKAGVNNSWFTNLDDDDPEQDLNIGYVAGVWARFNLPW
ncbi:MAG: hypothetical protein HC880_08080 [Bacteroidia bacterium]|nr:hypothetical protein [Bacteroidia bacterium]